MDASAFSKKPLSQKQKKTLQKKAANAGASAPSSQPVSTGEQADKKAVGSKANGVSVKETAPPTKPTDKAGSDAGDEKKRQTQWEQTKAMSAANDNFKAGK